MRTMWLCKKPIRKRAFRPNIVRDKDAPPRVDFEIFSPQSDREVPNGTVTRAKATCPCCQAVLAPERVRFQLVTQRGGADAVFDKRGMRNNGARMTAVVTLREGQQGRIYRLPTDEDYAAVQRAQNRLRILLEEWTREGKQGLCSVPNEPTPTGGGTGAGRAFSVQRYGMLEWGDLFSARQKVALAEFSDLVSKSRTNVGEILAINMSHITERNNSLCRWYPDAYMETVGTIFGRQALPIVWDFAEAVLLVLQRRVVW